MSNKHEVIKQLLKNNVDFQIVMQRITHIVKKSFDEDVIARPHVTTCEIKDRANMCYDLFIQLRMDLHFSTQKTLHNLPAALRSKLDGTPWTPPAHDRSWSASSTA